MEGLAALLAVPNRASLVYLVLTNDALLSSLRKFLNEKSALLRQIVVLTKKILVVVLNSGLIAFLLSFFLIVLNFFLSFNSLILFNILNVGRG
jgi:hypothetical protein